MEDDDEVVKNVDAPPPLLEPVQAEQPQISELCATASAAGDSSELMHQVEVDEGALPSIVDEVRDGLAGEDEVIDAVERDERGKEDASIDQGTRDDIAKIEDSSPVTEELEVKSGEVDREESDVAVDEPVKVEEMNLTSATEELEEKNEVVEGDVRDIAAEEPVKVEEMPPVAEELVVKNDEEVGEGREEASVGLEDKVGTEGIVKEEEETAVTGNEVTMEIKELEGEKAGNDGKGIMVVEQDDDESKEKEELAGEEEAEEMEDGNESLSVVTKHEELVEEETPVADTEMETETEVVKSGSGGKRKRGRNSKAAAARTPARKTVGEDVCFICLDGGDLVLCDRRGCPKAYHPSCVDHDDDFFKTKGRWNCGWHLCNNCGKNAYFMCFTCTFSLCKGCCKDAVVFCVRGNRGFCESCMKTIMMIENAEQNEMGQVAFDDKSSWEYLFKDYWLEQKRKLSITSDELAQAKNPWNCSDASNKQHNIEVPDGNNDVGTDSDSSQGHLEVADSKIKRAKRKSKSVNSDTDSSSEKDGSISKRKSKRRLKSQTKEVYSDSEHSSGNRDTSNKKGKRPKRLSKSRSMEGDSASASAVANEGISAEGNVEWASKELLEFVMHMKGGDTSVLSQFDVQALLLEYIKRNKLRDPRRQSQIICDSMFQKLFGKPRVGHFEMLKLLESHFLLKEDFQADDNHGSVVDDTSLDADDNIDLLLDAGRSKGRKSRKRGEERGFQSNLDDYAAIDMHNINLIYLRRNLIEALMEDTETFHDKVVGSFVRIRISGSNQKQDIYRLVQIIGTSKAAESYKVGKRTTDFMLEILNLDKTENVSIDTISNQEFTEDECKRLRQSIKCGLLSRMTVGDVLEKARELQEVRVIDWLEAEIVRLSHLRDRASEKGRKKELRECVEKLQLLKTPEERQRRLEEIPEVHADPKMDPNCESEDESEMDNKGQVSNMRTRDHGFFRRSREHFSSRKRGSGSNDSWSANAKPPSKNWELNRNLSGKGFTSRREDTAVSPQTSEHTWNNGIDKGTPRSNSWEKPRPTSDPLSTRAEYSGVRSDMSPVTPSGSSQVLSAGVAQTDAKFSETEKMWHYRDPTGKVQGPFSMVQLRKWSNTGYFPADLKIWKASQGENDSVLLTEVLAGKFQKGSPAVGLQQSDMAFKTRNAPSSIDASKFSGNVHGSDSAGRYGSSNLPSPTPTQNTAGWGDKQPSESNWSSASSSFRSNNQFQGGNERLPSPTPTSPSTNPSGLGRSNFSQQSKDSSVLSKKVENVGASLGIVQPTSVTNTSGQFSSTSGPRLDMSLNSGSLSTQQISSQSAAQVPNQSFAPPDPRTAAQGFSNVAQAGTGQNPPVYAHAWQSGFGARPEVVNANMTHNHPNAVPPQVPHGQWTGAPVNNQASSYGVGYPAMGNIPSNMPAMPSHNAWGPPANMPWGNQQQPPVNPNMGWAVPPTAAFGPSAVGQLPGPMPGAPAMPSGNSTMGWPGSGPNPSGGTTNTGWVAPPGNAGTWGGDPNRNGVGGGGGAQWNRQSSFGSGGQRVCMFHEKGHCRKGTSCDFMHT